LRPNATVVGPGRIAGAVVEDSPHAASAVSAATAARPIGNFRDVRTRMLGPQTKE
jgi:hypothetical protein